MPHIKITKRSSIDNHKEVIIFDGEITEEHNNRIAEFFKKMDERKKELFDKIRNSESYKKNTEKLRKEYEERKIK